MKYETVVRVMKPMVTSILQEPLGKSRKWNLQGFGMLRLYLSEELRLHVWDQSFAVPNVSAIHTHPWHFESIVIAGKVYQYNFQPSDKGELYNYAEIICGQDSQNLEVDTIRLLRAIESFEPGTIYQHPKDKIHESFPDVGTVTLCLRRFEGDRDRAHVFWPQGGEFVSAAARPATDEEVLAITQKALERYFQ